MNISDKILYCLQKYTRARILFLLAAVFLFIGLLSLVNHSVHEKPVIFSVSPQVASAGDKVVIKGKYFHNTKDSGFVEIAGSKLSGSAYDLWRDDQIVLTIPPGTNDGLLYVVSNAGRSNADFFASKASIPSLIPQTTANTKPVISGISDEILYVGQILTITGKNFGQKKTGSNVFFTTKKISSNVTSVNTTANQERIFDDGTEYIPASDTNFDYQYWSETEIRVAVPDGASTGTIYIQTDKGQSQKHMLTVQQRAGTKTFDSKRTYVIQFACDVNRINGTKNSILNIRFPQPELTSAQIMTSCTETSPKPLLDSFEGSTLFQIVMDKTGRDSFAAPENTHITQTHAVTVRSINTRVDVDYVGLPQNRDNQIFQIFTAPDRIVPAGNPALVKLLPNIIYQSKNPYRQAKLIYDYMTANYKVTDNNSRPAERCLELIEDKQGDAYEFAVIYAALLRTAGVPAKLMTGIFVDTDKTAHPHWWVEFFIENFGWIPADPAMGAGLDRSLFQDVNKATYYFGNLDSQHITFSQIPNNSKPALGNSKIKTYEKTWAFQSIWEETTSDVASYKADWKTPFVIGIY